MHKISHSHDHPFPELWGGVECTVNRVGDRYFCQLARNGHLTRPGDLETFARLGLRTLRYPVLWEQVAPDGLEHPDWSWPDERLPKLRDLGITPVIGFLHHGSGPAYTRLDDPAFPEKLARYAAQVAERYPWLEYFTPVNEPLTTARFSGLYGIWFPHGTDDRTFVRCLLQQCHGIVSAMEAVRRVIPHARLVATEDMGHTYATPLLQYQAEFENHRRWLTLDLLFGKVDRQHPFRAWLLKYGAQEEELQRFIDSGVRPQIVGLNYYITSDRMLDERMRLYPQDRHGGNGRHRYADVEAARAWPEGILGHREVLRRAWERYGMPVALTEVQIGSTREEQLRWFREAWQAAVDLKSEGVDVRAVTAWSLLGAFDWNRLLSEENGFYEPGAFDIRSPQPRSTALGGMLKSLSESGGYEHPILAVPGWWRRPDRFFIGSGPAWRGDDSSLTGRPLLIVGKTGTLGQAFGKTCDSRGLHYQLLSRHHLDIASPAAAAAAIERHRPWAVINTAGYVRVDEAENDIAACFRENAQGPAVLAAACRSAGVRLVTFSSDLVFCGGKGSPYIEGDAVRPLNVYGRSKAEAERKVLEILPQALVVRTSAFFGPWDRYNFLVTSLDRMAQGLPVLAAADMVVSPTYVPDLVQTVLDLLIDGETGIWHASNHGAVSWAELATAAARLARMDEGLIVPCRAQDLGFLARRPPHSVLSSERGALLPPLEDALGRYFLDRSTAAA